MAKSTFNRLLLSTGNIMSAGAEIIRRPTLDKSNLELVNSLRQSFQIASSSLQDDEYTNNVQENGDPSHLSVNSASNSKLFDWTTIKNGILYMPDLSGSSEDLSEDKSEYDITVKLFYLPNVPSSDRCAHTRDALSAVLQELNVESVDLLIVSFPNVSFDADDDTAESDPPETQVEEWARTYRTLEELHHEGKIKKIGLSEFGTARLSKILIHTKVKPAVDQINVRDCCVVPKLLILYARGQGIELLTHNDCTDIMPTGTLASLVKKSFPIISEDQDLHPLWVVKYTAVIKDRGVIENKGYFAMAEVR